MNNDLTRFLMFYVLCMGTRAAIALLAKRASSESLKRWFAPLFAVFAIAFGTIYAFNLRKSGVETFDGKDIWWNDLRPIHAGLYAIAAIYASRGDTRYAYVPLTVDVVLGFLATTYHRFSF